MRNTSSPILSQKVLPVLLVISIFLNGCGATTQVAPTETKVPEGITISSVTFSVLRKYGWSLPVCIWSLEKDWHPQCISVARLLDYFPMEAYLITKEISKVAEISYLHLVNDGIIKPDNMPPAEDVMAELADTGMFLGCENSGSGKSPVTLGLGTKAFSSASDFNELCPQEDFGSSTITDLMGDLVGGGDSSGMVSMVAEDQAAYETYFAQCQNRRGVTGGQDSVEEGSGSNSTDDDAKKLEEAQRKLKEAQEKAAEAQKKAAEAQKKAEEAGKKLDEASKKADETWNDPNATKEEKNQASQDLMTAWNDYNHAKAEADSARHEADAAESERGEAQAELVSAQNDYDYGNDVNDLVNQLGSTNPVFWGPDDWVSFTAGFLGTWLGHYGSGSGFDCLVAECGQTCEEEAKMKVLVNKLISHRRSGEGCDFAVDPMPDNPTCYEFDWMEVEVTFADGLRAACEARQKVSDEDCSSILQTQGSSFSFQESGLPWVIDPCTGPLVMCAPENTQGLPESEGNNLSQEIPTGFGLISPSIWIESVNREPPVILP